MRKLFTFELKRFWGNKLLIMLPMFLLIIGLAGIILGNVFYGNATPEIKLLAIYNAFGQFIFLFLMYVFVSTFTKDIKSGVFLFIKQTGYSKLKYFFTKAILLFLLSIISINIIYVIANSYLKNQNLDFLLLNLLSINLIVAFCIVLAMVYAVTIKNALISTLVNFGLYIVFNYLNPLLFGLLNPADTYSMTYTTLLATTGQTITHSTLKTINVDFVANRYLFTLIPILIYIIILLIITFIGVLRGRFKNEV